MTTYKNGDMWFDKVNNVVMVFNEAFNKWVAISGVTREDFDAILNPKLSNFSVCCHISPINDSCFPTAKEIDEKDDQAFINSLKVK